MKHPTKHNTLVHLEISPRIQIEFSVPFEETTQIIDWVDAEFFGLTQCGLDSYPFQNFKIKRPGGHYQVIPLDDIREVLK